MQPPVFRGIWREDPRARAAYAEGAGIYRIIPRAVAVPSTTRALVDLVRWAGANQVPLIPRGAGSGMPGGNVGDGVMVDLTALDGAPIHIDPVAMIATTGAAASLGELGEATGRHGLRMPVDPSSARWATSGGAVGTNAAGTRTVKYGPVRRWVDGVTLEQRLIVRMQQRDLAFAIAAPGQVAGPQQFIEMRCQVVGYASG